VCRHQELYGSSRPDISGVHSDVREALALYQTRLMTIEELLFEWHERGQQRDELLAVLEAVEWVGGWPPGVPILCPWCNRLVFDGHKYDCPREYAISRVRGDGLFTIAEAKKGDKYSGFCPRGTHEAGGKVAT
jgi:hypothetical protein